jgi:hypothetical protein
VDGPEGFFEGVVKYMNPYRQERLDGVAVPAETGVALYLVLQL